MLDQKDLDFIRETIEADGLRVPESLSQDAVRDMLDQHSQEEPLVQVTQEESPVPSAQASQEKPADAPSAAAAVPSPIVRRRRRRRIVAAAACAALIIGLVPLLHHVLPGGEADPGTVSTGEDAAQLTEGLTADATGLHQFESYKELDSQMKALLPDQRDELSVTEDLAEAPAFESQEDAATSDSANAIAGSAPAATAKGSSDGSAPEHSETYTQVEGIDEADIVKTDGNYIYYVSRTENQVIIARASDGKAKRVSAVSGSKAGSYINDLYISGDKLIVIGDGRDDWSELRGSTWTDSTAVTVYDISDRSNPKQVNRYTQTGTVISSRLIGENLCLVTNDMVYSYVKKRCTPFVSYENGDAERLPIANISCFPHVNNAAFTVIAMLDLSANEISKKSVMTKAVLGGTDQIYCSGQTLYVTGTINAADTSEQEDMPDMTGEGDSADTETEAVIDYETGLIPPGFWHWQTQVLKVSLAGGKVTYKTSAVVDGMVNNQFSMDERDGTFRIATTSEQDGQDVNNLFILDDNMKEIGCVIGFARDEHIEAVRYIRDKAYVITYEQTDPLFIIDLADPTDPDIEGHVKISGFSTLLVPADDDHLLGLGFSTETTEFGEATDGVKLALFDISDPLQPEVASTKTFPDMYSPVQYDHKALMVSPDGEYYAIPYEQDPEDWSDDDAQTSYGVLVFTAKAGQLQVIGDFRAKELVNRCVSIGDYLYGICDDDSIEGYRVK